MKSLITTLPPPPAAPTRTLILTKNGFTCSLVELTPGAGASSDDTSPAGELLLFVIDGEAAVHFPDDVTTMLSKESALHIPAGKEHRLTANSGSHTKLLRVEIPPRTVVEPEIVTFQS